MFKWFFDRSKIVMLLAILSIGLGCVSTPEPKPYGPVPTQRQLTWQNMEYYAFLHFNMNTFTNREWGHGKEKQNAFNPTELDTDQWCRIFKKAGMTGVVITAKHHDGFCIWPSKKTKHSVAHSQWRNGKGDVLAELSKSCKKYGLKFGVYISPWDRNNPIYGKDDAAYNKYFEDQLTELLTHYGEIFEVWWDGANGDRNNPDKHQEYDWPAFVKLVRKLQPNAVMFSDAGPDIRWIGTERGHAGTTNWSTMNRDDLRPGIRGKNKILHAGQKGGTHWLPGEVDVSIRPGWYYHKNQDARVKKLKHLAKIYHASVGRNSNLLLNIPIDRRGLVHENDEKELLQLRVYLDQAYKTDLARGSKIIAEPIRGAGFEGQALNDGDDASYWATKDEQTTGEFTVIFDKAQDVNRVVLKEHIKLGQRVEAFEVHVKTAKGWKKVASATTIGYKRIISFKRIKATQVKIKITKALACPTIGTFEVYNAIEVDEFLSKK